jgi:hypothetical protein
MPQPLVVVWPLNLTFLILINIAHLKDIFAHIGSYIAIIVSSITCTILIIQQSR